jgi:hypothetical protein
VGVYVDFCPIAISTTSSHPPPQVFFENAGGSEVAQPVIEAVFTGTRDVSCCFSREISREVSREVREFSRDFREFSRDFREFSRDFREFSREVSNLERSQEGGVKYVWCRPWCTARSWGIILVPYCKYRISYVRRRDLRACTPWLAMANPHPRHKRKNNTKTTSSTLVMSSQQDG